MIRISRVFALLAALFAAPAALAQGPADYPNHPVKIVVPFAIGGPTDLMARIIAQQLTERIGKPFYVVNLPGAGGNIGMGQVVQSPPDGHTLVIVTSSFVVNPSLYPKVPYDVFKDLVPVTLAATTSLVLVAHPSLPAATVKQLVDHLKTNQASVGVPGVGTTAHLAAETFKRALGLELLTVPFNGAGPTLQAVLAGHVQLAIVALATAASHVKQGSLRALAVTSEQRSPRIPDVPTMNEAGVPGDQISDVMLGVLVPAGTPQSIIDLLQREIAGAITQPEMKARLEAMGFDPLASSPEQFAARIRTEVPKWARVIRDAGIKPE